MMYRYLVFILVLFGSQVVAEPLSLSVTEISKDLAAETVDIKVIEYLIKPGISVHFSMISANI